MECGVLKVCARVVMADYMLCRRKEGCIEDFGLKGGENYLWLRNRQVLDCVANMALGMGYVLQAENVLRAGNQKKKGRCFAEA